MNKKHVLIFLFLSIILISLNSVNAENSTISAVDQSISNENILESTDSTNCNENYDITKNLQYSMKEAYSQIHYINNSNELSNVLSTSEDLTGKHIIELNNKELLINKDYYVFNDELELIINGNENQLTIRDNLAFNVKNVIFNNLILEFDDDLESRNIIDNYGNMKFNNVTIKDTDEYNKMISLFKEKGYYNFDDWNGVEETFSYSTRGMNINNKGTLYVNNSHFINNSGHSGTSIYNDGKIIVENTVFEDSLGKYGIIYSNNDSIIKNCDFKNNKVFQQLILTQGNSELTNTTFSNNIIAGSSILDNRGSININDCNFTNNTAKYDLVENWVYMDASNLNLCNNTCEELINSYGNLTLNDSFIKDNICSRSIILKDTLYYDTANHEIDKAGNVTLIGNKIFRGNVEYTDFFNNQDPGLLSLYNNTIYDKPDYEGDCIFNGNTFIADKNLYDNEGNYHGQKREMEIWHYMNYEIVDKENQGAELILYRIEPLYVNDNMEISGYLIDENNNAIANKEVFLSITDPEYDTTFFNPVTNRDGIFSVHYTPKKPGNYVVNSFYESDDQYDTATYDMEVIVLKRPIKTIIAIDPIAKKYKLDDEIIISGTLTDINNNPISNGNISIIIDKINIYESYNIVDYVLTDDNERYNYTYRADIICTTNVEVYSFSSPIYSSAQNKTSTYIVDKEFEDGILTLNPIYSKLFLGDTLVISGSLTDLDYNPLSNKTIGIIISGGESDYGIYSYKFNSTTDENGKYTYQHELNDEGAMNILVYYENDNVYGYLENRTDSYVGPLEIMISLDPIVSAINLGDSIMISGNLTDLNNKLLPNETLYINITNDNGEKNILEYVTTDNNGRYSFNYTPTSSGNMKLMVLSEKYLVMSYPEASFFIFDTNNENENNSTANNITENNETQDDEKQNIDNTTNPKNKIKNITQKIYHQTIKTHNIQYKPLNKSFIKKLSDKIILKINTNVTLSWLNNIFKYDFKNKNLLIYIDDILVFNGTSSEDPSEILFKVLEEYSGQHSLKVIADNNTYQKLVNII